MANSEKHSITLQVNGHPYQLELLPWVSLLDALRENISLTGTKKDVIMASAAHAPF